MSAIRRLAVYHMPNLVGIAELAERLNLQPETIRLGVKAGVIPFCKFSKQTLRFDIDEVWTVIQTKLRECGLPEKLPPKNKPGVAAPGPKHDLRKLNYKAYVSKSRKISSGIVEQLLAEFIAMGRVLINPYLSESERHVIRNLYRAIARKLRTVA